MDLLIAYRNIIDNFWQVFETASVDFQGEKNEAIFDSNSAYVNDSQSVEILILIFKTILNSSAQVHQSKHKAVTGWGEKICTFFIQNFMQ